MVISQNISVHAEMKNELFLVIKDIHGLNEFHFTYKCQRTHATKLWGGLLFFTTGVLYILSISSVYRTFNQTKNVNIN